MYNPSSSSRRCYQLISQRLYSRSSNIANNRRQVAISIIRTRRYPTNNVVSSSTKFSWARQRSLCTNSSSSLKNSNSVNTFKEKFQQTVYKSKSWHNQPAQLWDGIKNSEVYQSIVFVFHTLGLLIPRACLGYAIAICINEYIFLFSQCEGPSMMPTMQHEGEIVFVDRFTPRRYGIQGGSTGVEQTLYNKKRQKEHINKATTTKNSTDQPSTKTTWYETMIPVNELSREKRWERFFTNIRTGISRGDVVVALHPEKGGTICKRVIGLPGDEIILKQSQYNRSLLTSMKQQSKSIPKTQRKWIRKVPDGHVWLEGDNSRNSRDSREYGPVPAAMIVGRVPFRVWRSGLLSNIWSSSSSSSSSGSNSGDYLLERGMNPKSKKGQPRYDAQASKVIPAGYNGQRIIQKEEQQERKQQQQQRQQ